MKDFFSDTPWLQVPEERKAEIHVEPQHPDLGTGLLGGASDSAGPKVSKLAALAAARRKKENESPAGPTVLTGLAALRKTRTESSKVPLKTESCKVSTTPKSDEKKPETVPPKNSIDLPIRVERDIETTTYESTNTASTTIDATTTSDKPDVPQPKRPRYDVSTFQAKPSTFARGLFGDNAAQVIDDTRASSAKSGVFSGAIYTKAMEETRRDEPKETAWKLIFGTQTDHPGFAGPSPDAVGLNARSGKGPTVPKEYAKDRTEELTSSRPNPKYADSSDPDQIKHNRRVFGTFTPKTPSCTGHREEQEPRCGRRIQKGQEKERCEFCRHWFVSL
jgi:elongation factor 1 alpha-like protein